ncbi:BMP family lipoprotein [Peptoniphilaceae bacterium SGI.131]
MKKYLPILFSLMLALLVACGSGGGNTGKSGEKEGEKEAGKEQKSAILIVNGSLGDLGFFDSANAGMKRLEKELGMKIKVVETGDDDTKWEPALADAADEKVDYIIAVSPSMVEPVQRISVNHEDKKFILIDNAVDYSKGEFKNVYSATFKQNEGSFLAGVSAAHTSKSGKIGFVGGMDIPAINDFLVGYIEGAKFVNPNIKVLVTYPGDYYDPAKGKEHALVLMNEGVDVIFTAAGPTGLGSIQAATDGGIKVIGVDSDQSSMYKASGDNKTAEAIVTSMVKQVGNTIFRTIEKDLKGELKWGEAESLGIAESGVELAKNDVYEKFFTAEQKKSIDELSEKVVKGEIKVSTAIGMSLDDLNKLKKSVAP